MMESEKNDFSKISPKGTMNHAGSWPLETGSALALDASEGGRLLVSTGEIWATWDGAWGARPEDSGDFWLGAGAELRVPAGRRVVLEASRSDARFTWDSNATEQGLSKGIRRALSGLMARS